MNYFCVSDKGISRENNEDSYRVIATGNYYIFIVADGMGGHNGGEIASKLAVDYAESKFKELIADGKTIEDIEKEINNIMNGADELVSEQGNKDVGKNGMGTTIVIAVFSLTDLFVGHAGDSRAYLIRENKIIKLTKDHSLVQELLSKGMISEEEAFDHPKRNVITRAVGLGEGPVGEIKQYDVLDKDRYIFCTDGLTSMLKDEKILEIVLNSENPKSACEKLLDLALEAGGKDNITIIATNKKHTNQGEEIWRKS